jgi:hypothetical protein
MQCRGEGKGGQEVGSRKLLAVVATGLVFGALGLVVGSRAFAEGCKSSGTAMYSWDPDGGYRSPTEALTEAAKQDDSAVLGVLDAAPSADSIEALLESNGRERIEAENGPDRPGRFLAYRDDRLYSEIEVMQLPGGGFVVGASAVCST